jgi:hypothetical protein
MMKKTTDPALKAALKLIAKALTDAEPYSAYRIRNVRYNLLRARGIAANRTYERTNPEIEKFVHVRPVTVRHINRMSSGNKGRTALSMALAA